MSLRPTPIEQTLKRLRVLLWGATGVGKTWLLLHFPGLLVLDSEGGTEPYHDIFDFASIPLKNIGQMVKTIEAFEAGTEINGHNTANFKTLGIDSISDTWDFAQDFWARQLGGEEGEQSESGLSLYRLQAPDWRVVKADNRHIMRRATMLETNIVCTAHEKTEYKDNAYMVPTGRTTFDGEKKLERWFDTVIHLTIKDGEHIGFCTKDRSRRLPMLQEFVATYDYFAKAFGEEIIEQPSSGTSRSTQEQRKEIERLRKVLGITPAAFRKALAEYDAENMGELTVDQAQGMIDRLTIYQEKKEKAIATS